MVSKKKQQSVDINSFLHIMIRRFWVCFYKVYIDGEKNQELVTEIQAYSSWKNATLDTCYSLKYMYSMDTEGGHLFTT